MLKYTMAFSGAEFARQLVPAMVTDPKSGFWRSLTMLMCLDKDIVDFPGLFDPVCAMGCADDNAPDHVRGMCGRTMAAYSPACATDPKQKWCGGQDIVDVGGDGTDGGIDSSEDAGTGGTDDGGDGVSGGDTPNTADPTRSTGGETATPPVQETVFPSDRPAYCRVSACGGQASSGAAFTEQCAAAVPGAVQAFCETAFFRGEFPRVCDCLGAPWTRDDGDCDRLFAEACAFADPLPGEAIPMPFMCDACDFGDTSTAVTEVCTAAVDAYWYARCVHDASAATNPLCQVESRCRGRGFAECRRLLQSSCTAASTLKVSQPDMCRACSGQKLGRLDGSTADGAACLQKLAEDNSMICSHNGHFAACDDDSRCSSARMSDTCVEAVSLLCGYEYGECALGCNLDQVDDGIWCVMACLCVCVCQRLC